MLYLHPEAGLCNRLRTIASSWDLTQEYGDKLKVWWSINGELKCRFEDLFEMTVPIRVRNQSALMEKLFKKGLASIFKKHYAQSDFKQFVEDYKADSHSVYYLSSFSNFYNSTNYTWVKPIETLQKRIDEITAQFGNHCVGIHIRRTDNQKAIEQSPLSLFLEVMDRELEQDPDTKFYLATDDSETKIFLTKRYSGRVLVLNMESSDRVSKKGMQDAVVDLYTLAATDKIYGSYWSSFSAVAADIGKKEIEILKK